MEDWSFTTSLIVICEIFEGVGVSWVVGVEEGVRVGDMGKDSDC